METYKAARIRLMKELGDAGWTLSPLTLKVPHATSPHGDVRFWFKPQAIWYSVGRYPDLSSARSTFMDMRRLDAQILIGDAERLRRG